MEKKEGNDGMGRNWRKNDIMNCFNLSKCAKIKKNNKLMLKK